MLTAKFFIESDKKKKKIFKAKGSFNILSFKYIDMRAKVLIALVNLLFLIQKNLQEEVKLR